MNHQPDRFEPATETAIPEAGPAGAEAPLPPPPRRLSRRARIGAVAVLLLATAGAGTYVASGGEAQVEAPPPPPDVTVSAPLQRAITEWDDYTGRFEASQAVDIRPRVSGQLVAVHYRDGDIVRKGQLLFTIDQRPFQAALAEARARAASAETQLALARSEYARAARLLSDEAISREEVDALRAAVKSGEAAVAAARATMHARQLDLDFTQIRASTTGRISDRRVDVGNLVSANDTLLTTLYALDPIYFTFDGSEALYLKGLRARGSGADSARQVEIRLQDETGYNWRGRVDFTDNAIDPGSGTMRGRAVIANPDYFLAPGMFGNMRLASGGTVQALLVPDAAVRTDQARKVVFVVAPDGTVAARPVEPGPMVGGLRSIRAGLQPEDRVVIKGVQFAMPGGKVNAKPGRIDPPVQLAAAPARIPHASQATLATN